MHFRIRFSKYLLALGSFIQSLPVVIMKPDHLVEFSRQSYAKPNSIESWSEDSLIESGLAEDELKLLSYLPERKGDLLLLGVGGGREAIPLAKMGFQVTGVDYIPTMVDRAKGNAIKHGTSIEGLVQEISNLMVPECSYDIVWLSRSMYSCVPTRARRVQMVQRIFRSMKPGGYFLCQFHREPLIQHSRKSKFLRQAIAVLTWGNTEYQEGDKLLFNKEFLHPFSLEQEIRSELEDGGLSVLNFQIDVNPVRCGVICRKD